MSGEGHGGAGRNWLALTLVTGAVVIAGGFVVGGILGFASGAAIGAAVTDTARDCHFEECADPGILPGAAIGLIVGAVVGAIGMATLWVRRIWRTDGRRGERDAGSGPTATSADHPATG